MRAVSFVLRERAAAALHRYLAQLSAIEGSALDPLARSVELLAVRAWLDLHSLPGIGFLGGQHARAFHRGLREILRADRHSFQESAGEEG